MVTHYPQIAPRDTPALPGGANRADAGFGARALTWIRQAYCALHGHDRLLHFEKDRMSLRCASCGHDSPGWELKEIPRPTMRLRGETRRPALRPHLVDVRRIA